MSPGARFLSSAERVPTATALVVDGDHYRYEQLLGMAAGLITTIEVRDGTGGRIALLAPHSLAHYVGTLAAVLSGRSFVPLRPADPEERLLGMLREAEATVIICDDESLPLGDRLAKALGGATRVVVPSTEPTAIDGLRVNTAEVEAYLMYTSGSTGAPKGVPISTANMDAVLSWADERYDITEADRFAQTFDPSFDLWVFTTFAAWSAGAAVVDLAPEDRLSPRAVLERERVTVWFSTPTHARLIRQLRGLTPGAFPTLRWSLFCGEALSMADASDWQVAAPNSQLENLYGPTEATQVCAGHRFPKPLQILEPDRGAWAPIGEVFPHLTHVVVDEAGKPVGRGEEGELWIAGSQVFAGYLHRAEETEHAFAEVESATGGHLRFYKTGDIVRSDRRGRLRFVGRADSQVKVMGHRIELGELEAHALSCDGVDGAVAVTFTDDTSGFGQIALTLAGAPGVAAVVEEQLKMHLPRHMQPRRIVELDSVPTTPSGKIDRRRLAELAKRTIGT